MIEVIKKEAKLAGKCSECGRGRIVYQLCLGSGAAVSVLVFCDKCRRELIRKLRYLKRATEEEELAERFKQI